MPQMEEQGQHRPGDGEEPRRVNELRRGASRGGRASRRGGRASRGGCAMSRGGCASRGGFANRRTTERGGRHGARGRRQSARETTEREGDDGARRETTEGGGKHEARGRGRSGEGDTKQNTRLPSRDSETWKVVFQILTVARMVLTGDRQKTPQLPQELWLDIIELYAERGGR